MEKKLLITATLLAATSLFWVFHFLGRDVSNNHFTGQTEMEMRQEECPKHEINPLLLPMLTSGYAVAEQTHTSYVIRHGKKGVDQIEQVRLTVEKPSCTVSTIKECKKRSHFLPVLEKPRFSIETLQVQLSNEMPGEYEFIYQRLRGNWSDLEAHLRDSRKEDFTIFPATWQEITIDPKTPPSI
jgi:hypothetical protein